MRRSAVLFPGVCDGGTLTDQLQGAATVAARGGRADRGAGPGPCTMPIPRRGASGPEAGECAVSKRAAQQVPHAASLGPFKITDFGLAKRIDDEAQDMSKSGAIMGTASYMAPEQAAGKVPTGAGGRHVRAGGAAVRMPDRPAAVRGAAACRPRSDPVLSEEPAQPSQSGARVAAQSGDDLSEMSERRSRPGVCQRGGAGRRPASFPDGEPIRARAGGSGVERVVKWMRAGGRRLGGVLLVTVLGTAGVVWKYLDAEQQKGVAVAREEAQHEAAKAKKSATILSASFELSDASGPRGTVDRPSNSGRGRTADSGEVRQPAGLQKELLEKIGAVYDENNRQLLRWP